MTLWSRLMGFFQQPREEPVEATQARELARSISERADQLTEHFQTYQRSRDPFAAMMADMYNRDQLSRLHKGQQ